MSTICSILCLAMFFCNGKIQKSTFIVISWLEEKDKELKVLKRTRLIRKSRENTTPAGERKKERSNSSMKTTTVDKRQQQKQTNLLPLAPVLVLKCCGQILLKYLGFQPAAWMKRKPFLLLLSAISGYSRPLINTSSLHFHRCKLSSSLPAFCQTEWSHPSPVASPSATLSERGQKHFHLLSDIITAWNKPWLVFNCGMFMYRICW